MTDEDWNRSEARQKMIEWLQHGTPLPDVMIDSVLHVWFARVGEGCLLTRSEILIQGEHAEDDRKNQCRDAYKRIQRAMKDHAQRIGMGRHANESTETPTTNGDRTRGVNRERDRKDDRRSGFNFSDDTENVARMSGVRNEKPNTHTASGNVSTRASISKRSADSGEHVSKRSKHVQSKILRVSKVSQHSAKNKLAKSSAKRSTVAPKRK